MLRWVIESGESRIETKSSLLYVRVLIHLQSRHDSQIIWQLRFLISHSTYFCFETVNVKFTFS